MPRNTEAQPLVTLVKPSDAPHTFRVYRDVPVMIIENPHTGQPLYDVVFPEKRHWVTSFQAGIDMIDAYHLDKDTRVFCRRCGGARKNHRCVDCSLFSFNMEALTAEQRDEKFAKAEPIRPHGVLIAEAARRAAGLPGGAAA